MCLYITCSFHSPRPIMGQGIPNGLKQQQNCREVSLGTGERSWTVITLHISGLSCSNSDMQGNQRIQRIQWANMPHLVCVCVGGEGEGVQSVAADHNSSRRVNRTLIRAGACRKGLRGRALSVSLGLWREFPHEKGWKTSRQTVTRRQQHFLLGCSGGGEEKGTN